MEPTINKNQKGFAMLFTVLIVSLILSIAVSISNLTLKQSVLSGLAKDSQIAFYQSDAGVECGIVQDLVQGMFPLGSTVGTVPPEFYCGDNTLILDDINSAEDYFIYSFFKPNPSEPCFRVVFDKRDSLNTYSSIQGYGYNICDSHPRQVERALELKY